MNAKRSFALILILILLMAVAGLAQSTEKLPTGVISLSSVEGVTEYKLENGLRVLMVPDDSSPKATVNVVYLVGSRDESYGETGMAHLLEHLMFKGTPSHPNIPDELTKHGAMPNGTTNVDRTNYFEIFSATDENLSWALSLEADRMVNSFIAKKDLDSEMTVVRNEMERGENDPENVLNERVLESAYLWHNYGHPTIGARSDVEGVPIEKLQAFYHKYYQPDDAVLVVAGKIDPGKTLALIVQKFGAIPRPTRVLSTPYTEEPVQDGPREVTLRRVGDVQVVMTAYHIPPSGTPDAVAMGVLADILSDPATGRLRKRLVDTKLATAAGAEEMALHDPGLMQFYAELPKDGNIAAVRKELIDIAQGIGQDPVTQEELDRVRRQRLERFDKMMADGNRVGMMLTQAIADGDWRLLFWQRDQLKKLTVADIQRVAEKYLIESNLTVGEFIPVEKPVRATIAGVPDYAAMLKDYHGEAALSAGEQFDPSPSNIEARTTRTSIGPIKLALLPKKTRGNLVSATFDIHFGTEAALMNRKTAATLAASLLMRGTSKHDMQQLRDALTALKTQVQVQGGPTGATIILRSDREHLDNALKLAAEVLQSPTFPEKEFDELKRSSLSDLEQERTDPQSIAVLALRRSLSPYPDGHVYGVPTLDESIDWLKATTLEDVKKFYKDFYGIGAAEVAIVGDFDPKAATQTIAELFSEWKSPAKYERVPSLYKAVEASSQEFNTPDKQNAVFLAGTNLQIRDDDPHYPGLILGNYLLGGGFLNSRLAVRIRQKEGLSYGVGSQLQASALDKAGTFTAFAISAPQNQAKVAKAFNEEVQRALTSGFTVEELNAAKSGYLQSRMVMRSDDTALSRALAQHLFDGRDFRWDEQYEKDVRDLTVDQVGNALKEFLNPKNIVIMEAGDQSKAGS